MKINLFYLSFIVLFVSSTSAIVPDYSDRYVNDYASVLNSSNSHLIGELFSYIEKNTSVQLVFVSVQSTSGVEISDYALDIGQNWGVGQKDKNNGIVILYVLDVNKIWVATGYGVEGILPDSKIGRFLDEYYVPFRDLGNAEEGIIVFSFALADELSKNSEELFAKDGNSNFNFIFWIIIFLLILLIIISIKKRSYVSGTSIFIPKSGGGGFSGFGGGSFGGGGAGR